MLIVRIIASLGLFLAIVGIAGVLINDNKHPNSVEWLLVILAIITILCSFISIWIHPAQQARRRSWLGLYLERKRLEEEARIKELQGASRKVIPPPVFDGQA